MICSSVLDLQLGELLHDGHLFGLFEAMSAIEMMDPKMDAGMLCRGNPKPLNFQQAVAVSINKLNLKKQDSTEKILNAWQDLGIAFAWGNAIPKSGIWTANTI